MARRRRLFPAEPGYVEGLSTESSRGLSASASLTAPIAQVSGQSAEAAALREMALGLEAARGEGRMIVEVPLADISPAYFLRDRVVLDKDEMNTLKASIRLHGQRTPAEITPLNQIDPEPKDGTTTNQRAPRFGLISGWRRLTALNELYNEDRDPRFSTLRALVRPVEAAADSYVAMVEENEIRVGLSYYERARLVAELTHRGVFPDQSAGLRMLFAAASRAKRSKIGSFIDIHTALGDVLRFPEMIPERLGLAVVSRLREEGHDRLRGALSETAPTTPEAELVLLESLTRVPKGPSVAKVKPQAEMLAPGVELLAKRKGGQITLTLSGQGVTEQFLETLRQSLRGS